MVIFRGRLATTSDDQYSAHLRGARCFSCSAFPGHDVPPEIIALASVPNRDEFTQTAHCVSSKAVTVRGIGMPARRVERGFFDVLGNLKVGCA